MNFPGSSDSSIMKSGIVEINVVLMGIASFFVFSGIYCIVEYSEHFVVIDKKYSGSITRNIENVFYPYLPTGIGILLITIGLFIFGTQIYANMMYFIFDRWRPFKIKGTTNRSLTTFTTQPEMKQTANPPSRRSKKTRCDARSKKPNESTLLIRKICKCIKKNQLSSEEACQLSKILIEYFPEVVGRDMFDNDLSGMYAYVLNFHKVKVYMKDGTLSKCKWKVVKLGMSKESLTNRLINQCRGYYTTDACVKPKIPGFMIPFKGYSLSNIKKQYPTAKKFADYVKLHNDIYKDMIFIYPGLITDETHLRKRYGICIGKWILETECLNNFFDGDFDVNGVVFDNGTIKSKGGWKIWMTSGPGKIGVSSYSPGPSEYFLMREEDIDDCKQRFLNGEYLTSTRNDPASDYTSLYSHPIKCIIYRWDGDDKPLVLLYP